MPDRPAPSYADLARELGLAKSTIVAVLTRNGQQRRIAEATQERVRLAADQLGWQPPRKRRAGRPIFALYGPPLGFSIYNDVTALLTEAADRHGADLMTLPQYGGLDDWRDHQRDRTLAGIVLPDYIRFDPEIATRLGIPAVLLNLPSDLPLDQVVTDDADGIRQAVTHLIAHGHRCIAWTQPEMRDPAHPAAAIRATSVQRTCTDAGVISHAIVGNAAMADLLRRTDRPTALVVYDELHLASVLAVILELGLRVPADVALACSGYGGCFGVVVPALLSIEVPLPELCETALSLLLRRHQGFNGPAERRVCAQRLILRS
jgi:LacI family transcriptional regulator